MAEAGRGAGVVPQLAISPAGHAALVSIPLHEPRVSRTLGLIHRRGRELNPVARLSYDFLVRETADNRPASVSRCLKTTPPVVGSAI